ncbi:MBL fold metallo-hydrolase [Rhodococcus sp. APC 3903]|uniref:MBL fold metallo-hydrolase n=1 Tax=Rhodococcus sp. APC 3903 TaxID=3035193 RepID=UPI0025B3F32C|nr:MBL fold metallo-hydrolase [Rhodococcus sp. APC 3903]MDN3460758.1 MBL fold metallo-hydrolase [Rhodococcus sp. APC 3903]
MCLNATESSRPSRRSVIAGALGALGAATFASGCSPSTGTASTDSALGVTGDVDKRRPHVVLLGTAGGPSWYPRQNTTGISTAVVVGDAVYVVDTGDRAPEQYFRANPTDESANQQFRTLRGLFVTHMHSDHAIDYFKMFNYGWWVGLQAVNRPVEVFGPGRRNSLTTPYSGSQPPPPANPSNPMPGITDLTDAVFSGYASDINDRVRDNRFKDLRSLINVHDIAIPNIDIGIETLESMPAMAPFPVYEDDRVRVTATLVNHFPVFPAFAYRFDTDDGSVVISGDTGKSANLAVLAADTDLLLHEVIDIDYINELYELNGNDSLRQHLMSAHMPSNELGQFADDLGARQLALHHLVPAEPPRERWAAARQNYNGIFHVGTDLAAINLRP